MIRYIPHSFGANQTIDGAIKLINGHDITPAQLKDLNMQFNFLNDKVVPRVGESMKIPVLDGRAFE